MTALEPHTRVGTAMSPNLLLNEQVADRRLRGLATLHLGFGEAGLPLLAELAQVLADAAPQARYSPVAGTEAARVAVAGYFQRRGLVTDPAEVVLAPGSKPLLFATIAALDGDVYLGELAWNSYAPQVRLAGHIPIRVPIGARHGGMPDPGLLRTRIEQDRELGRRPVAVIVNSPDNPTGNVVPRAVLAELCAIASAAGLTVISDEIYRDLSHLPEPYVSPAELLPERTVICTGLSKSLAIGGWRIGAARFPGGSFGSDLRDQVLAVASDLWSTLAAPMQAVAAYAFAEPPAVTERLRQSRRLHAHLAHACYRICRSHGATVRQPGGAFYVYADFTERRAAFAQHGATDSASLAQRLLDGYGVAVLAGHHLGDDPERLAFKIATTGLIGETEDEQLAALAAADPTRLPHVQHRLRWLDEALAGLGGDRSTPTGGRST